MSKQDFASRISFIEEDCAMEVDFSDLTFSTSDPVNAFYDEMDRQLRATGEKWFFLVNYHNCVIMPEAWISFAHRGKKSNIAFSLGSARFAASEDTKKTILEKSQKESFNPNLFTSRELAMEHLQGLRAEMPADAFKAARAFDDIAVGRSYEDSVSFFDDLETMEIDFSDFTFESSSVVNAFYDVIENKIKETGKKWFVLVNYSNCTVLPEAWIAFASRSRQANQEHSRGTVRYEMNGGGQSESDGSDRKLVVSREAALARIAEMRSNA